MSEQWPKAQHARDVMSDSGQTSSPKRRPSASKAHERLAAFKQRQLVLARTEKRLEERERAQMGQSVRATLNKMMESDDKKGQDRLREQQKELKQKIKQRRGWLKDMTEAAKQKREDRMMAARKGKTLDMEAPRLPRALQLRLAVNGSWLKFNFNAVPSTLALVNVGAVPSAVPFTTLKLLTVANRFSASDASVINELAPAWS